MIEIFFKITVENPDYYSIYMESIDKIKYNYGIDNKHTLVQKQLGATIKTTFIDTLTKIYEADEFDTSIFSDFDKMFIKKTCLNKIIIIYLEIHV